MQSSTPIISSSLTTFRLMHDRLPYAADFVCCTIDSSVYSQILTLSCFEDDGDYRFFHCEKTVTRIDKGAIVNVDTHCFVR